jgi:hypothetical protein
MLAHACPFNRGSAAVSENLINTIILVQKNKSLPNLTIRSFKKDILPDLEGLVSADIEKYAQNYRSIYE